MKHFFIAAAIATLTSEAANAENYFGGNIGAADYEESEYNMRESFTIAYAKAGRKINPHFSIEGRAGFGLTEIEFTDVFYSGDKITGSLDHFIGLYVVPSYPLDEKTEIYAIVGKTRMKATAEYSYFGSNITSESSNDTETTTGFGVNYKVEGVKLNLEWVKWGESDGAEISGFNFGVSKPF
jgi:opacity protein-like surface antigen